MSVRAGAPFMTPGDVLEWRHSHGMSDSAIECLAFGRMCCRLPDGVRHLINQKVHGDPAFREHYLVMFDPNEKPIDLITGSAYPEGERAPLPPGYEFETFFCVGEEEWDINYSERPEEARCRAFFTSTHSPDLVWTWVVDEEPKDSRWEMTTVRDVNWASYNIGSVDEAYKYICKIINRF